MNEGMLEIIWEEVINKNKIMQIKLKAFQKEICNI